MGILDQLKNVLGSKKRGASGTDKPGQNTANTYTVQSGDTLWSIADKHYGDGSKYLEIFEANRGLLESPEHIVPGQQLVLPKL